MNITSNLAINEFERLAVRLPTDATVSRTRTFLAVTLDVNSDTHAPAPDLLPEHAGLRYLAQYELMSVLCAHRAQQAVDGRLRCRGSRVTPEQYLGLWRKALAAALTPQELYDQRGWSLTGSPPRTTACSGIPRPEVGMDVLPFPDLRRIPRPLPRPHGAGEHAAIPRGHRPC